MSHKINIEETERENFNFINFDECFNFFFNFPGDSSFLMALTQEDNYRQLTLLIGNYANHVFEIIKKKIKYRINDKTPLTSILIKPNCEQILSDITKAIKEKKELRQYENFLTDLDSMMGLLNHLQQCRTRFELFDPSVMVETDDQKEQPITFQARYLALKSEFADFKEAAIKLGLLLKHTNYEPISQYLGKFLDFEILLQPEKPIPNTEAKTAGPFNTKKVLENLLNFEKPRKPFNNEPVIYNDIDSCYILEDRTLGQKIIRYIVNNPKKLIFGGLLGLGLVALGIFFWPVVPSALIIFGSMVGGGVLGTLFTGGAHYIMDEEARRYTNSPKIIPVTVKPHPQVSSEVKTPENIPNTAQQLSEKNIKENLVNFLQLLNFNVPPVLLMDSETKDLVSHIRFCLDLQKAPIDPFNYLLVKNNLTAVMDFALIKNVCLNNWVPLNLEKNPVVKRLEKQVLSIKAQAFLQLYSTGSILTEKIQKIDSQQSLELQSKIDKITPQEVAETYFNNLLSKKDDTRLFELYSQFRASNAEGVQQECKRIRNTLLILINRVSTSHVQLADLDDNNLVALFFEKMKKIPEDDIPSLYLELVYTTSPKIYNFDFLPQMLKRSGLFSEKLNHGFETSSRNYLIRKRPLLNAVRLFINGVSDNNELPFVGQEQQLMSSFFQKLDTFEVSKIINFFSELRFNIFAEIDLIAFKKLIHNYYKQTDIKKGKEFAEGISYINHPNFIAQQTQPLLQILKRFLIKGGVSKEVSLEQMSSKALLPILFDALSQLTVKQIIHLFSELSKEATTTSAQLNFCSKLFYNYFEFQRPADFSDYNIAFMNFAKSIDSSVAIGSCSAFFNHAMQSSEDRVLDNLSQHAIYH